MSQLDRATKKAKAGFNPSDGWGRYRMNATHRNGRRAAKKIVRRARRRVDRAAAAR